MAEEINIKKVHEKWQKKWADAKIFQPDVDDKKKKFFLNFPYPYINAYQHIGHLFTLMRVEALAKFKRLQGYNVLFPQGWHATGSPIVNAAKRVKQREPKQMNIMKDMGISEKEWPKFEKPEYWIDFFMPAFREDYEMMGISIDWRREFHTTSLNPHYDKFIKWQFNKLKEKNYVIKGKFPVVWCPNCSTPIGDHSRSEGEGETTQEFTLLKFKFGDEYIVAATLRPETVYGQTNLWVDPEYEYIIAEVNNEKWILSKECILKLKDQDKTIKEIGKIKGKNMIGKYDEIPFYIIAVYCLGELGETAGDAVPRLLEMLDEEHEYPWSRNIVIGALGEIGPESNAAIPALRDIIISQEVHSNLRGIAIRALGSIGSEAGYVMSDILPMIGSINPIIRKASAEALTLFARSIPSGMDDMSPAEIKRIIPVLVQAQQAILASEFAVADTLAGLNNERIDAINSAVYALKAEYNSRPFVHIRDFAARHQLYRKTWVWVIAGYVLLVAVCLTSWFVLLWWKPFWLYTLNRKLRNPEITPEVIGITFGLRQILWLSWFNYHHRVLDAWVEHNFVKAREAYGNLQTVKERHYYVPLPLNIDENFVERPEPDIFRKIFERDYFNLIIHGEGGSGKTSLACRLAHWAMGDNVDRPLAGHSMLPVMIEHNLTTKLKEQKHPLLQAIHTQVELATEDDELRPELIQQLLRKRRILVIVDRFSEMNAETREIILAGNTRDLKINALIITSRLRESLRGSRFTSIEPLRIDKDHLMPFMTAYLIKENLNDSAYFEACTKLSRIAGPRGITALLARLFAEQMRLLTDKATTVDDMPGTIIDLMIGYLNWLNRNRTETDMDNHTLQRISSVIAWKAIEKEYKPSDVSLNTIQNELADEVDLENKLHYLDKKLGVIRYTGESMRRLRISLDPLAEYLAALHLLNLYRDNEVLWSQFVESAQSMSKSGVTIEGFLIAVIDCILAEGEEYGVSEIIFKKLQSLIPRKEDELEIAV